MRTPTPPVPRGRVVEMGCHEELLGRPLGFFVQRDMTDSELVLDVVDDADFWRIGARQDILKLQIEDFTRPRFRFRRLFDG